MFIKKSNRSVVLWFFLQITSKLNNSEEIDVFESIGTKIVILGAVFLKIQRISGFCPSKILQYPQSMKMTQFYKKFLGRFSVLICPSVNHTN